MKIAVLADIHANLAAHASEPARGKWVGPTITGPAGGQLQTAIYYGPWQCNQRFMDYCSRKCSAEGHALMGCMWIADIKMDWKGRFLVFPVHAGGRLAITHCCCDYPTVKDVADRRDQWDNVKKSFRRKGGEGFGEWPMESNGNSWPGHHIRDLLHGGAPKAENNVLPVPPSVHDVLNKEYPACYSGSSRWKTVGPSLPYTDCPMQELLEEISRHHFPNPPATSAEI